MNRKINARRLMMGLAILLCSLSANAQSGGGTQGESCESQTDRLQQCIDVAPRGEGACEFLGGIGSGMLIDAVTDNEFVAAILGNIAGRATEGGCEAVTDFQVEHCYDTYPTNLCAEEMGPPAPPPDNQDDSSSEDDDEDLDIDPDTGDINDFLEQLDEDEVIFGDNEGEVEVREL